MGIPPPFRCLYGILTLLHHNYYYYYYYYHHHYRYTLLHPFFSLSYPCCAALCLGR